MAREKILIVEDEKDILDIVKFNLLKEAYRVSYSMNGIDALKKIASESPDLILLDIMLPDVDGIKILKSIKNDPNLKHISIIMLTAKGEEGDIIAGLELGADDYITKPFSPKVLLARIKAVLRRRERKQKTGDSLVSGDIRMNSRKHEAFVEGVRIDLTKTEFNLLHYLISHPGWVFTRNQIIEAVHGEGYPVTDRSVDVQIVGLRKKLGKAGEKIEAVRGIGYRYRD